ncbi:MAG: hypothetical protein ACYC7D_02460 [Nitrososphaerales archaeon]
MPATIILDTDFLIKITNDPLPKFDYQRVSNEYSFATIPAVISELKGLRRHRTLKTARRAGNALRALADTGTVKVLEESEREEEGSEADARLIELADESGDFIIATMDHSLLSLLEKNGAAYLTLRNNRPLFKAARKEQRI